ncbi:MAG TPA: hypothetical protein VKB09_12010, partial [Thermomicrobiales bacterium]|nr:hypothetical protein [Thermomicrobiales bacterium]
MPRRPTALGAVPAETARVARAAFPQGTASARTRAAPGSTGSPPRGRRWPNARRAPGFACAVPPGFRARPAAGSAGHLRLGRRPAARAARGRRTARGRRRTDS